MKKLFVYVTVFVVILIIISFFLLKNKKIEIVQNPPTGNAISMCYQYSKETSRGFVDRVWLQMNISGSKVTGEYQSLLAEKDSKVGTFSGTVGPMDPKTSSRIADVWWDSEGEGMSVTEQLKIEFGEGSAVTLGGEMMDRGDGTYVYKDATLLTPGLQMSQIDCESLQDQNLVDKYVRDNINTIVPDKPVLGGSWYATVVNISPSTKSGTMILTYEDGHIQESKSFSYVINNNEVQVNLIGNVTKEEQGPKEPVACTMDAKQCPDGSYVGRTGPNCEFICPETIPSVPKPKIVCPFYSTPAPGWCSDGIILPPVKDSNGCYGHPICKK